MTLDVAKVRALAERAIKDGMRCGGCLGDVPIVDGRHNWRGGGMVDCPLVTPPKEVVIARAALAMCDLAAIIERMDATAIVLATTEDDIPTADEWDEAAGELLTEWRRLTSEGA
jgi:hypothetical protein